MAATKGQRIGIWIIAIALVVGTIGSFMIMVLANDNQQVLQERQNELTAEYQKEIDAYEAEVAAQADDLSDTYYEQFSGYTSRATSFDEAAVTELTTTDIVVGDGEVITPESSFTAYYIGWNPDGTIFDSSIDGESLKAPFDVTPGGVITGWTEGTDGMKVGGVRELTIPSELAYGERGSGDLIAPNTPLKFIVMVVPTPATIEQPQASEELLQLLYSTR